ncbi:hypothetical protein FRB93_000491 [Tulasnella sp. JGI-2019a]|nr:hypothetical protein FRB93_000491 [Tulasnella sp. JGI-2019a]
MPPFGAPQDAKFPQTTDPSHGLGTGGKGSRGRDPLNLLIYRVQSDAAVVHRLDGHNLTLWLFFSPSISCHTHHLFSCMPYDETLVCRFLALITSNLMPRNETRSIHPLNDTFRRLLMK